MRTGSDPGAWLDPREGTLSASRSPRRRKDGGWLGSGRGIGRAIRLLPSTMAERVAQVVREMAGNFSPFSAVSMKGKPFGISWRR